MTLKNQTSAVLVQDVQNIIQELESRTEQSESYKAALEEEMLKVLSGNIVAEIFSRAQAKVTPQETSNNSNLSVGDVISKPALIVNENVAEDH